MAKCANCQNTFSEQELVMSEHGAVCQACELDLEQPMSAGPPKLAGAAIACAIAPFVLVFQANGLVYTSLIGGVLTILLSVATIATYVKAKQNKWAVAGVVALFIGLWHIVSSGLF